MEMLSQDLRTDLTSAFSYCVLNAIHLIQVIMFQDHQIGIYFRQAVDSATSVSVLVVNCHPSLLLLQHWIVML